MDKSLNEKAYQLSVDGVTVAVTLYLPARTPIAAIQIVHGLAEHGGRYRHVAEYWRERGYAVVVHDHRGHGRSVARDEDAGCLPPGTDVHAMVADIGRVHDDLVGRFPALPVVMYGHSMGSILAQSYALRFGHRLSGLILSACDFRRDPLPRIGLLLAGAIAAMRGWDHRSPLLQAAGIGPLQNAFPDRRTNSDWLCSDPAVVDAFIADPRCGFTASVALWRCIYQGLAYNAGRARLAQLPAALPLLLISGKDDPLNPNGAKAERLARAWRRAGVTDIEHRCYPGRHEVHNEPHWPEVAGDIDGWIRRWVLGSDVG